MKKLSLSILLGLGLLAGGCTPTTVATKPETKVVTQAQPRAEIPNRDLAILEEMKEIYATQDMRMSWDLDNRVVLIISKPGIVESFFSLSEKERRALVQDPSFKEMDYNLRSEIRANVVLMLSKLYHQDYIFSFMEEGQGIPMYMFSGKNLITTYYDAYR